MSYRYYANKRLPKALWMLDDTPPFQEHTGSGLAAGTKAASSDATKHSALVAGAAWASVFSNSKQAEFTVPTFVQGRETEPFVLEATILVIPKTTTADQKVLSHAGAYDGITVNGTVVKFATEYLTAGRAECSHDIQVNRAVHVAAVHTESENLLYIDGELVDRVEITDAQKADTYVATDGKLYVGASTSDQEVAVNGVAFYRTTSPKTFEQNTAAARMVVPEADVYGQFDGQKYELNSAQGSRFLDRTWSDDEDFLEGTLVDVSVSEGKVTPAYESGLSLAGSITLGVPLDGTGETSIYGVMVEWSGQDVTAEASLDGTTWSAMTNGRLLSIISNGYDPTGKDLELRFSFAGGLADDPAFVESVKVVGFVDANISNGEQRTVSVSHPAVPRDNHEPILYRNDNGVTLAGGTLTIGADTGGEPTVVRTLELLIKPLSGTPTISVGGTKYRNGVADSTLPVGEWSIIHYVNGTDISGAVTVTGDCIVGHAVTYPTALSSTDVDYIYKSYTGVPVLSFSDSSAITLTEPASPTDIYTQDWAIDPAG